MYFEAMPGYILLDENFSTFRHNNHQMVRMKMYNTKCDTSIISMNADYTRGTIDNDDWQINIDASGGYGELMYSLNGIDYQADSVFSGIAQNDYVIIAKDTLGCTESILLEMPENCDSLNIDFSYTKGTWGENDWTIYLEGETPYSGIQSYSINGGTTFLPSGNFTGLANDTFAVAVKDSLGCIENDSIVMEPYPPTASYSLSKDTVCQGEKSTVTLSASGGTGVFDYSIDGGKTYSDQANFDISESGTYELIVKDKYTGQSDTATLNFEVYGQYDDISFEHSSNGLQAEFTVIVGWSDDGLQYSLNNGDSFQDDNSFYIYEERDYELVVKDSYGCTLDSTVHISLTGIKQDGALPFSIYPQPAGDHLYIDGLEAGAHVRIVDIQGTERISLQTGEPNPRVDISTLSSGAYMIIIRCGGKEHVGKLIVN